MVLPIFGTRKIETPPMYKRPAIGGNSSSHLRLTRLDSPLHAISPSTLHCSLVISLDIMDVDMKIKDEDKSMSRGDLNGRERDKERDRRDNRDSRDRDRDRRERSRDRGGK